MSNKAFLEMVTSLSRTINLNKVYHQSTGKYLEFTDFVYPNDTKEEEEKGDAWEPEVTWQDRLDEESQDKRQSAK